MSSVFQQHGTMNPFRNWILLLSVVLTFAAQLALAGPGTLSAASAPGLSSAFNAPTGIAFWQPDSQLYMTDREPSLLVVDTGNHRVARVFLRNLTAVNVYGTKGTSGTSATRLQSPQAIVVDQSADTVYIADTGNNCIRAGVLHNNAGLVTTLSGSCSSTPGTVNGTLTTARFAAPVALALNARDKYLFVADRDNHCIRLVLYAKSIKQVKTLAGLCNYSSSTNGLVSTDGSISQDVATFVAPLALALVGDVLYVGQDSAIRKIDVDTVSTVSGTSFSSLQFLAIPLGANTGSILVVTQDPSSKICFVDLSTGSSTTLINSAAGQAIAFVPTTSSQNPGAAYVVTSATSDALQVSSKTYNELYQIAVIQRTRTKTRPANTTTTSVSPSGSPSASRSDASRPKSASSSDSKSYPTLSRSGGSPSRSLSRSQSEPKSSSRTVTPPPTHTKTHTPSFDQTSSPSPSPVRSRSLSGSMTETSKTFKAPPTRTDILTRSGTSMQTASRSISRSVTPSQSTSASRSNSGGSASQAKSATFSNSMSNTSVLTLTMTRPPTTTKPPTKSRSRSVSITADRSQSGSQTAPRSMSVTSSLTDTKSNSETKSSSNEVTASINSMSMSTSGTFTKKTPTNTRTQLISTTPSVSGSASMSTSDSANTRSSPLTTSAIPPTTTEVATPTWTLLTECSPCMNGECSNVYPVYCICYDDSIKGYWQGGNIHGGICDKCVPGVYGANCLSPCPGGRCTPCNGNGVCFDGTTGNGTCGCYNDPVRGYWTGVACNYCVGGWFGKSCNVQCNCSVHGACIVDPSGNSISCNCDSGWTGPFCDVCMFAFYGPTCAPCPGFTASSGASISGCNGHGYCDDGLAGTGQCTCYYPYVGSSCTSGIIGNPLDCSYPGCMVCPGPSAAPCNGRGNCTVSSTHTAECKCQPQYGLSDCSLQCPIAAGTNIVCNGRGVCDISGSCSCDASNATGYWDGVACENCANGWSGPGCTLPCPRFPAGDPSGAVCNGAGVCTSGLCHCNAGSCGSACQGSCAPCPPDGLGRATYGPACDHACMCVSGSCNSGPTGDGSCLCKSGYVGAICDVECQGGHLNPCSGHGACQDVTGSCVCAPSYGTMNCSVQCPYGLALVNSTGTTPCSNHGICSDGSTGNGRCTCYASSTNGYWDGAACDRCLLGYSGVLCNIPCVHGITVGRTCNCFPTFGGPSCSQQCPYNNDTTPGSLFRGLCSNQGVCNEGSNGTGSCICQPPYEGPGCNCTQAYCTSTGLRHAICSPTSGTCQCDDHHSGDACLDCSPSYWGQDCTEPCACRTIAGGVLGPLHGTCARATGTCTCFRDPVLGYWDGADCSVCASGYFGITCQQRAVVASQTSSIVFDQSGSLIRYRTTKVIPDDDYRFVYVTGDVIAVFNTSTLSSSSIILLVHTADLFNCTTVIADAWLSGYNIFFAVRPQIGCRTALEVYSWPRFRPNSMPLQPQLKKQGSFTPTGSFVNALFVYSWSMLEILSLNLATGNYILEAIFVIDGKYDGTNSTWLSTSALLTTLSTVNGMTFSSADQMLVVFGSQSFGPLQTVCAAVGVTKSFAVTNLIGSSAAMKTPLFISFAACSAVQNVVDATTVTLFAIDNSVQIGIAVALSFSILQQALVPVSTTLTDQYTVTAMSVDTGSGLVLVSGCLPGELTGYCSLIKYTLDDTRLTLEGLQSSGLAEEITYMATSRMYVTYVLFTRYTGILARRILNWEVAGVFPPVADVVGMTPLTIVGRGFHNTGQMVCSFIAASSTTTTGVQPRLAPAKYINDTAMVCIAAPSPLRYSCDKSEVIELSLDGVAFTSNGISIDRIPTPTVTLVNPDRQKVYPRGARPPSLSVTPVIALTGVDFNSAPTATCLFTNNEGVNVSSKAIVTGVNTAVCYQPFSTVPFPTDTNVRLSIDGTVFSQQTVPYLIVGDSAGLQFTSSYIIVASAVQSYVPGLVVYVVDVLGNSVALFDTYPYPIHLSVAEPYVINYTEAFYASFGGTINSTVTQTASAQSSGSPITLTTDQLKQVQAQEASQAERIRSHQILGNSEQSTSAGAVIFDNVFFVRPVATETTTSAAELAYLSYGSINQTIQRQAAILPVYVMLTVSTFAIDATVPWTATIPVYIVCGAPDHLVLAVEPSPTVSERGDLSVPPTLVVADASGNLVIIENPLDGSEALAAVFGSAPINVALVDVVEQDNPNRTAVLTNGQVDFRNLLLFARHGFTYRYLFSIPSNPHITPVWSRDISSSCPAGTFMLAGAYACSACLPAATCDGQNISVAAGYWRGSALSSTLYQCSPANVCPGGAAPAACASTYTGPLCKLCETGFAKGIRDKCTQCLPSGANIALIAMMLVAITGLISVFVVYTVQNGDHINNAAIVLQLFVSHWQTIAVLPYFDNPWPSFFASVAKLIDGFADFRVMDTSFGECLLNLSGLDFRAKFIFQVILVCEIFVAVGVSRAVLFLFPNILRRNNQRDRVRPTLPLSNERVFITSALVGIFFLYQGTLFYSLGMLNCQDLVISDTDTRQLLVADVSVDCTTPQYWSMRLAAWPISFILLIGVPVGLVLTYWVHAFVKPKARNLRYQCGAFLLGGLTKSAWYWPAVVFIRKGLLVAIVVLVSWPVDAQLATWLLVAYILVLVYVKPYQNPSHQFIELFGNTMALLCINIATMYHTAPGIQWIQDMIAPLIITLESLATCAFLFFMSEKMRRIVLEAIGLREPEPEIDKGFTQNGDLEIDDDHDEYRPSSSLLNRLGAQPLKHRQQSGERDGAIEMDNFAYDPTARGGEISKEIMDDDELGIRPWPYAEDEDDFPSAAGRFGSGVIHGGNIMEDPVAARQTHAEQLHKELNARHANRVAKERPPEAPKRLIIRVAKPSKAAQASAAGLALPPSVDESAQPAPSFASVETSMVSNGRALDDFADRLEKEARQRRKETKRAERKLDAEYQAAHNAVMNHSTVARRFEARRIAQGAGTQSSKAFLDPASL